MALSPAPANFTERHRADQRSALSLYEVISHGLDGTQMGGYADRLSRNDRWALAYYVGSLAYSDDAARGERLWRKSSAVRVQIANLKDLSQMRAGKLAQTVGQIQARAIIGYLRQHPEAVQSVSSMSLARQRLAASLGALRLNERTRASALALSAYLDGVEPVEPRLNARDPALRAKLEAAMGAYRTTLDKGMPLERATALEER